MNYLDIILILPLAFGFIKGLRKGLVFEVASLVALIIGIWGAVKFSYIIADMIGLVFNWESPYLNLVALVATFILIVIVVNLIAKIVDKIIDAVSLGFLNTIAGGVFGLVKVGVILGLIALVLQSLEKNIPLIPEDIKASSVIYQNIISVAETILPLIDLDTLNETVKDAGVPV